MSTNKRKRELIPPWEMPSDPVKAVFWFMHWLLKVVVHFFWVAILGMVIYESYANAVVGGAINGAVGGVVTLLIGLVIWGALFFVLQLLNVSTSISRTIADVSRLQQNFTAHRPFNSFPDAEQESKIVEGTITDLEEERKKRRRE